MFDVLDGVLAKQEWLVAGKPTVADLSFLQYVLAWLQRKSTTALMYDTGGLQEPSRGSKTTITRRSSLHSTRKSCDRCSRSTAHEFFTDGLRRCRRGPL